MSEEEIIHYRTELLKTMQAIDFFFIAKSKKGHKFNLIFKVVVYTQRKFGTLSS